ncbi:hypothetical protein SAMN02746065_12622 [Desulfocicer vacuolatum DSM 3385]|uniref:ArsC family protein n=1 Tax=Desulfocicer vacuolatum DSM 3385 TaxID=1121400 RepID=A0A1W2E8H2_9BACT|nr:hypothetical protein SAMN02746065_12622 [Desulfocicer vacuolatum DSM 3385]
MKTVVDARKERFDADAAWEMIKSVDTVTTAKGKKVQTWHPATDDKDKMLKQVMGPSGNLRAPTLRMGNRFIIGFNDDLYENIF